MVEKFKDNEHDDRRIGRGEGGMVWVGGAGEILSDVCSLFIGVIDPNIIQSDSYFGL